jgi:hypothetical protein
VAGGGAASSGSGGCVARSAAARRRTAASTAASRCIVDHRRPGGARVVARPVARPRARRRPACSAARGGGPPGRGRAQRHTAILLAELLGSEKRARRSREGCCIDRTAATQAKQGRTSAFVLRTLPRTPPWSRTQTTTAGPSCAVMCVAYVPTGGRIVRWQRAPRRALITSYSSTLPRRRPQAAYLSFASSSRGVSVRGSSA